MCEEISKRGSWQYVLITAASNEDRYIEKTIQSVIKQTIPPLKWIIVSDRSTDRTDEIVRAYAKEHAYIELLRLHGGGGRSFGSQVRAINAGYQILKNLPYKYIGNVDADVTFPDNYFEMIIERFEKDERLGIAGGYIYEKIGGVFTSHFSYRLSNRRYLVANAAQMFRRSCFENIGGYIELKYGSHDTWANVMAWKLGWKVENIAEIKVYHHRPTSSSLGGFYKSKWNDGLMDYTIGNHPIYQVGKCILRFREKPYVIASAVRMAAYIWAYLRREERGVSKEFIKFYRKMQFRRIFS
jgi:glycosyltransferase involved in cell wall biosynthesis